MNIDETYQHKENKGEKKLKWRIKIHFFNLTTRGTKQEKQSLHKIGQLKALCAVQLFTGLLLKQIRSTQTDQEHTKK